MPTGTTVRTACQGCNTPGRYGYLEICVQVGGVYRWGRRLLCNACRSQLYELALGTSRPGTTALSSSWRPLSSEPKYLKDTKPRGRPRWAPLNRDRVVQLQELEASS